MNRILTLGVFFLISKISFATLAEGNFSVLPRFNSFTLKSTDKGTNENATLASKLNLGAEFDWILSTEQVELFLFTDFQYAEISQPSNKSINEPKHLLVGGGLGLGYYLDEDKKYIIRLVHSYQQNIYFRAATASELLVDKFAIPDIQLRFRAQLKKTSTFTLMGEIGGDIYLSIVTDHQNIRNGYGGFGKILAGFQLSRATELQFGPAFFFASHDTQLIDQTRTEYTILTGIKMFLD